MNGLEESTKAGAPKHYRRLKADELVGSGDYIKNERRGLERWEGPSGFRADSFVRPIYRRHAQR